MRRTLFVLIFGILFSSSVRSQIHVGAGQRYPDIGAAAHARVIHAGDTVYLHAGTYTNSTYWIDSLIGTSDKWITIRPWQNDSVSIHEQYTMHVAQYVRLEHLHFFGNDPSQASKVYHLLQIDYEYECFTANHHLVIADCEFTDLNNTGKQGSGAFLKFTGTDSFRVERCTFRNGTNVADGISMNGNRNGVITECRFDNISGYGSHAKGGTKNILYEKNLFIDCAGTGIDVGGETGPQFFCPLAATWEADSILIYSNIFIGGRTGIQLSSCHNSYVVNNTCFKTTSFAFRSLNASSNGITLLNNHIYNNIFTTYSSNRIYLNASAGGDYTTEYFKNNLFHDYKNADPAEINWAELPGVNVTGTIIGDPLFADTLHRDFSLLPGSPARGMGTSEVHPMTDYFEHPYNTPPSIGAIESSSLRVTSTKEQQTLRVSPNPATERVAVSWKSIGAIEDILVFDLLGRTPHSVVHHPTSPCQIDLHTLAAGRYTIVARTTGGAIVGTGSILKQ